MYSQYSADSTIAIAFGADLIPSALALINKLSVLHFIPGLLKKYEDIYGFNKDIAIFGPATCTDNLSIFNLMSDFYKFHGTGNDFILINGFSNIPLPAAGQVALLCNRRTGIGADGLIIIQKAIGYDFEMVYYNADGSYATMCGNGARCAAAFAYRLGICGIEISFLAGDGAHTATIVAATENEWMVEVSINNVALTDVTGTSIEINTGTDHLVILTSDPDAIDVMLEGKKIRFSDKYAQKGININWLKISDNQLRVRTYERGVEAETLSCGTGVTACAVVAAMVTGQFEWDIATNGGMLHVSMTRKDIEMSDIRLKGPAILVFSGILP